MEPEATSGGPAAETASQPLPVGRREIAAVGFMLVMFVSAQVLALLLTPSFDAAGIQGFDDPEDWTNGLVLIGIILAFTAVILFIARKRKERLIQWIILVAVGMTIAYVFFALEFNVVFLAGLERAYTTVEGQAVLWLVAFALAAVPTWLLYTFPEWYVVDLVGILVSAGAVAIFGTSFTPLTYTIVLAGTAVYDAISVYKTKHMLDLADSVLELHLPIMLVVPKSRDYSFLDEKGGLRDDREKDRPDQTDAPKETGPTYTHATPVGPGPAPLTAPGSEDPKAKAPAKGGRDAMFIGLGDIVIPSILIVSAASFAPSNASPWPAFGALLGTLAGFLFLMSFVLRGKPQAGLPSLNGGAFLGFLLGFWAAFGRLDFWAS
jgi:presenilin-like A22 family membrane protease